MRSDDKTVSVRAAKASDAAAIATIYEHYVARTVITFEEISVSAEEMALRMAEVASIGLPWLIIESNEALLGYAYATRWKTRTAYRHSVETTIYLRPDATGRRLGLRLYSALLDALCEKGLHLAIGGIALPNDASIALHERLGFEKIGYFTEIGFKQDRWVDVGYWQLKL